MFRHHGILTHATVNQKYLCTATSHDADKERDYLGVNGETFY
jgi:hypothetical protein